MRPVRTLTGTTQTGLIKFTWARSESMKWLHETGTRLQIGINVYMKHAGSSYFPFVVCFIVPFIVKGSTKNTTESEEKRENYSVSFFCSNTPLQNLFPHISLTLSFVILNTTSQDLLRSQDLYLHIRSLMRASIKSSTIESLKIQRVWFS